MVHASEYLGLFLDESREHLQELNESLLELERDPTASEALVTIFRAAHTLKGTSATMGFEVMARLTHRTEEVLSQLRDEGRPVTGEIVNVLFSCLDTLESMVEDIAGGGDGQMDTGELLQRLAVAAVGDSDREVPQAVVEMAATVASAETAEEVDAETDRHPEPQDDSAPAELGQYDRVLRQQAADRGEHAIGLSVTFEEGCMFRAARAAMVTQAIESMGEIVSTSPGIEELETERPAQTVVFWITTPETPDAVATAAKAVSEVADATTAMPDLTKATAPTSPEGAKKPSSAPVAPAGAARDADKGRGQHKERSKAASTLRVGTDKLDELMNLMGEMVIQRTRLSQLAARHNLGEVGDAIEDFGRVANDLQALIMQVRLTAVGVVFMRFPRMVRDLSRSLDKELELIITGEDTELDRAVIDELGDPLVHLLRNAVDHGIEPPDEREAAGKDRVAKIHLTARHTGNSVEITVSEDGRGIDPRRIRESAVSKGLMSPDEADALTDQDAVELIFQPGFTTAKEITDVSGRGVGMDVVRSKIRGLNGEVLIETALGEGTTFTVTLPLTLGIIQALLVRSAGGIYALPLEVIEETVILARSDTRPVNGQDCMVLRDPVVPLVALRDRLNLVGDDDAEGHLNVVVVRVGEGRIGVVVDSLIGQRGIVIKHLPDYLGDVVGVAGATTLGDGSVALIVDVGALRGSAQGGVA